MSRYKQSGDRAGLVAYSEVLQYYPYGIRIRRCHRNARVNHLGIVTGKPSQVQDTLYSGTLEVKFYSNCPLLFIYLFYFIYLFNIYIYTST